MPITLKIELQDIAPSIWRRIVVPSDIVLDALHTAIQGAFAWQDCHLHQFEIDGQRYEIPESPEVGPMEGYKDEQDLPLRELVRSGAEFTYIYDFGDDWHHRVTVEKSDNTRSSEYSFVPICVAGERAGPPEDCGGSHGYAQLIEALNDSSHFNHQHLRAWSLNFQSEEFSTSQANSLMAALYMWHLERKQKTLNIAPIQIACPEYVI